MANPFAGEVAITLDGAEQPMKLTLGALAELEAGLGTGSLLELVARFESKAFSATDILHVIFAGLRGGGWPGKLADLSQAEIQGGPIVAATAAAQLLALAFAVPQEV